MRSMRRLMRQPDREAPVNVARLGQRAIVLHRRTGQPLADHGDLGDGVGTLERVDVGTVLGPEAHVGSVLGEQDGRIGSEAVGRCHDRLQRRVVDDDGLTRVHAL